MKRTVKFFLAALIVGIVCAAVASAETITGELVDTACFAKMGAKGEKHKDCAIECATKGIPLGILDESSGEVYTLAFAPAPLAEYAASRARITGKISGHLIVPEKLEVEKEGTFQEVALPKTMM